MDLELARPDIDEPLLRYSLSSFRELIFASLEAVDARFVVEVGSEAGSFTEHLVRWVTERDGRLISIDPAPGPLVVQLAQENPGLDLQRASSLDALPRLEVGDAFLLDGDHNYYTVRNELDLIAKGASERGRPPLILVQDVGWPTGRRDMYYNVEKLPAENVRPYTFAGVVPWSPQPVTRGGFRGEADYAVAQAEGGPSNGVLTAVEDFLDREPGFTAITVSCFFGLLLVYPSDAPWADALAAVGSKYDDDPLLARLEANRIRLYLHVLELNDVLVDERHDTSLRITNLTKTIDDVRSLSALANQRVRQLEEDNARLRAELEVAEVARLALPPPPAPPSTVRSALSRVRRALGA